MITAKIRWTEGMRFDGIASSGHPVIVDGDSKTGNSPMELVLVALCGCTGYDVASILKKKREPFTAIEISAEGEKAPEPPRVYTSIKLFTALPAKSRARRLKTPSASRKKNTVQFPLC